MHVFLVCTLYVRSRSKRHFDINAALHSLVAVVVCSRFVDDLRCAFLLYEEAWPSTCLTHSAVADKVVGSRFVAL